ncbi:enhanced intracellular survival protein Eis [Paenibacillus sp. S150]|uniref:GNAT family N-acetyltransferase n=1 Tax=Paenibacillus sp. S150 TaxID=2749826 RepID=UPI001C57C00D|nr:GNAT family N-acetyltransferase [Paenibacillus sp. S150]MBW4084697.1 GNAT family N-acetyltransferase [Paenibacillus sp. S150]
MEIRQLYAEEFEASLSLSEYAFKYKITGEDRAEAKQNFKPEILWGAFEDGVLGAQLTLLPLQVYIQGKAQSMGGIAGVSTWPENRRQGLVSKLLSHTLQTMNESGQSLSFLHPFLIPFYRKFGWEVYCEYKKYSIPVDKFPRKTEVQGSVKRDSAGLETLEGVYSLFAAQYNGTLRRDQEWWKSRVLDEETHHCVFYSELGEPEGYVLYKIINNELVIDEFIYLSELARRGLWTFLSNHDSMITGASLKRVPSDDILPYLLPDPRISQENFPYFMARIVNARTFVENFTFRSRNSLESRTLYIEDLQAPWNNGLWQWSVTEDGTAALNRLDGEKSTADLSCTIGTFTVLLLGYKRPGELARYGQLIANPAELNWLEEIIPQGKTALFDFF